MIRMFRVFDVEGKQLAEMGGPPGFPLSEAASMFAAVWCDAFGKDRKVVDVRSGSDCERFSVCSGRASRFCD